MTNHSSSLQFATQCIHAGYTPEPISHASQVPLYFTSSYSFPNAEAAAKAFEGEGYVYSRVNNPTCSVLEKRMAQLEGLDDGLFCSSGLSALMTIIVALAQAGDEILVSPKLYGGSFRQFVYNVPKMGITPVWMDLEGDLETWAKQITPKTRFIYVETPANPTLHMVDIKALAQLAQQHNIPLVVDNTFCTPYLQQPATLGADIILHSTTKYLTGNSTALGGLVLGKQDFINSIRGEDYRNLGPAGSPFNAWMVLLSLETLPLRMDKHCANALQVVDMLSNHPKVASVNFPGLASHPQHHIAKQQMSQFGAMISFEMKDGYEASKRFLNQLQLFSIVANLGDSRSLAIHPASTTHSPLNAQEQASHGITPGMIRLSIGLEAAEDILADLTQAFSVA